MLERGGSKLPTADPPFEGLRLNHFPGFEKKFANPPDGDTDRGWDGEGGPDNEGPGASSGLRWFGVFRGAIN